jgi:hypothetical protein
MGVMEKRRRASEERVYIPVSDDRKRPYVNGRVFLSITVVMVFLLDLESIQREELVFGPDDEADALRMYLWFSNTRNAFYISVYHRLTARGRT